MDSGHPTRKPRRCASSTPRGCPTAWSPAMSACPPKGRIEVPTSEETTVLQGVSWQSAGLTRAIMSVDGGDEVRGRNRRTLGRT